MRVLFTAKVTEDGDIDIGVVVVTAASAVLPSESVIRTVAVLFAAGAVKTPGVEFTVPVAAPETPAQRECGRSALSSR